LPVDGFSQKLKHVASNKIDVIITVTDSLYLLFYVHKSQRDVTDKDILFCFSPYLTENRDMTHSRACHMMACHYTYSTAPCLFLAQTEPCFRSRIAILWLCDVVLRAWFSTISTASPGLSQRKRSFCCITRSLLTYFFSLISYLTEGSLSYRMFDAQLFFGLNVYLTENTVLTTTAGVTSLVSSGVTDCHYICVVAVSNPPASCEVATGAIVGGLVATQLEICFFQNFWAFDTQQSIAAVINRSHMNVEIHTDSLQHPQIGGGRFLS
jgi:hypothetical protein